MSLAPVYLILGFAGFYKNEIIAAAPNKNLLLSLEVKGALNQYLEALPIKKKKYYFKYIRPFDLHSHP